MYYPLKMYYGEGRVLKVFVVLLEENGGLTSFWEIPGGGGAKKCG